MRLLTTVLATALLLPLSAQDPKLKSAEPARLSREERAKLPRLAILEFKAAPDCWSGWRYGGWSTQMGTLSSQLLDLLTTECVEQGTDRLRLVDRERLDDLRRELELQQSGEMDVPTVQKVGKLLGVTYVLTGKITRFAYKDTWSGSHILATGVKKASFTGRLDLRLFEVQTGEILQAFKEEGAMEEAAVKVLSAGTEIQYDGELVSRVFEPMLQRVAPRIVEAATRVHREAAQVPAP